MTEFELRFLAFGSRHALQLGLWRSAESTLHCLSRVYETTGAAPACLCGGDNVRNDELSYAAQGPVCHAHASMVA